MILENLIFHSKIVGYVHHSVQTSFCPFRSLGTVTLMDTWAKIPSSRKSKQCLNSKWNIKNSSINHYFRSLFFNLHGIINNPKNPLDVRVEFFTIVFWKWTRVINVSFPSVCLMTPLLISKSTLVLPLKSLDSFDSLILNPSNWISTSIWLSFASLAFNVISGVVGELSISTSSLALNATVIGTTNKMTSKIITLFIFDK